MIVFQTLIAGATAALLLLHLPGHAADLRVTVSA